LVFLFFRFELCYKLRNLVFYCLVKAIIMIWRIAALAQKHQLSVSNHWFAICASYAGWTAPQLFGHTNFLLIFWVFKALNVPCIRAFWANESTYTFFLVFAFFTRLRLNNFWRLNIFALRQGMIWIFTSTSCFILWYSWIFVNSHDFIRIDVVLRLIEYHKVELFVRLQ